MLYGLDIMVPSTVDCVKNVWVTAWPGKQELCRQKGFVGAGQEETNEEFPSKATFSIWKSSGQARRNPARAMENLYSRRSLKGEGEENPELSKKTARVVGHAQDCHDPDNACSSTQ